DVVTVAAEDRETQVVADQRADPPALPFDGQAVAPGGVAFVFVGVAEQVALVVVLDAAVGGDPEHAVEDLVAFADLHASGDGGIGGGGVFAHPGQGGAIHGFGIFDGVVGEAAGEGFRKDDEVGDAAQGRDEVAVVFAVAGGIVPAGLSLDQGNAQIVHVPNPTRSGWEGDRLILRSVAGNRGFWGCPVLVRGLWAGAAPWRRGYRSSRGGTACPDARAIHPCIACRDTPAARARLTPTAMSADSSVGARYARETAPLLRRGNPAGSMRGSEAPEALDGGVQGCFVLGEAEAGQALAGWRGFVEG